MAYLVANVDVIRKHDWLIDLQIYIKTLQSLSYIYYGRLHTAAAAVILTAILAGVCSFLKPRQLLSDIIKEIHWLQNRLHLKHQNHSPIYPSRKDKSDYNGCWPFWQPLCWLLCLTNTQTQIIKLLYLILYRHNHQYLISPVWSGTSDISMTAILAIFYFCVSLLSQFTNYLKM